MDNDKLDALFERMEELHYDVLKLENRIGAVENELRLLVHETNPQLIEMRQEMVQVKRAVESISDLTNDVKPIEALQPPPRR